MKKKYTLIEDRSHHTKPEVRIINIGKSEGLLTYPLLRAIGETVSQKKNVLLILNRKGHSILQCTDCGHTAHCPDCNVPLIYYSEKELRCHYCNKKQKLPAQCPHCRGVHFKFPGSGTEKVFDLLKQKFTSSVSLIDSEHTSAAGLSEQSGTILLGTDFILRKIQPFSRFGLTAILNVDIHLNTVDFRGDEKLFQHISYLSELNDPESHVYLQTFDRKNPFFSFIRKFDYKGFFSHEIRKRELFHYPPFFRLALLSIKESAFQTCPPDHAEEDVEVLGPIHKRTGRKSVFELLVKSRSHRPIQQSVTTIIDCAAKERKSVKIDIDPLMFT